MAMGTERMKPLHNFSLPWDVKWVMLIVGGEWDDLAVGFEVGVVDCERNLRTATDSRVLKRNRVEPEIATVCNDDDQQAAMETTRPVMAADGVKLS
ncbi:hypothetical protein ACFX1Z_019288 [Malus domestica]